MPVRTVAVVAKERARYSNWVKQQVRLRYPLCRTTEDKRQLAAELNIRDADGEPSVPKLYNLASRLGATGRDAAEQHVAAVASSEERLLDREDPDTTEFSRESDRYLRSEFGRKPIGWIAVNIHHTETAVAYRARQLGLRKPVKYWNVRKVALWLSLTVEELRALRSEGIDVYPQHDRHGHLQLEVVSTSSLARWLKDDGNLARARAAGADEFFIREVLESMEQAAAGESEFEACKFLSHGHVCQNPYAQETSFGLYCTDSPDGKQKAGRDKNCRWQGLAIEDLRPDA